MVPIEDRTRAIEVVEASALAAVEQEAARDFDEATQQLAAELNEAEARRAAVEKEREHWESMTWLVAAEFGCPNGPLCNTCEAAGEDDVCLPHEAVRALKADRDALKEALEAAQRFIVNDVVAYESDDGRTQQTVEAVIRAALNPDKEGKDG